MKNKIVVYFVVIETNKKILRQVFKVLLTTLDLQLRYRKNKL